MKLLINKENDDNTLIEIKYNNKHTCEKEKDITKKIYKTKMIILNY